MMNDWTWGSRVEPAASGCRGTGRRQKLRWLLLVVVVSLLLPGALLLPTAAAEDVETVAGTFLAAVAANDLWTAADMVSERVFIEDLEQHLTEIYRIWQEEAQSFGDLYADMLREELWYIFSGYTEQYYEGIDPVDFFLYFEASGAWWDEDWNDDDWLFGWDNFGDDLWVDPYGDDWEAIWQLLIAEYGDEWDEMHGPDWDLDTLEQLYFEMYEAALAWDQLWAHLWDGFFGSEWDDDWEDFWGSDWDADWDDDWDFDYYADVPAAEMAVLTAMAELLEPYRQLGDGDGYVEAATTLYMDYMVSDAAWRASVAWAVADYLWIYAADVNLSETGTLWLPGESFLELLLTEELVWDESTAVMAADDVLQATVTAPLSGSDEALSLFLYWEQEHGSWKITGARLESAHILQSFFPFLAGWIGFY